MIGLGDKNINENSYYNCRPHVETLEKKLDTWSRNREDVKRNKTKFLEIKKLQWLR